MNPMPPEIIEFARRMRHPFPNVKLYPGVPWPGGNDTENAKLKARKRK